MPLEDRIALSSVRTAAIQAVRDLWDESYNRQPPFLEGTGFSAIEVWVLARVTPSGLYQWIAFARRVGLVPDETEVYFTRSMGMMKVSVWAAAGGVGCAREIWKAWQGSGAVIVHHGHHNSSGFHELTAGGEVQR